MAGMPTHVIPPCPMEYGVSIRADQAFPLELGRVLMYLIVGKLITLGKDESRTGGYFGAPSNYARQAASM